MSRSKEILKALQDGAINPENAEKLLQLNQMADNPKSPPVNLPVRGESSQKNNISSAARQSIAIVGMAGRYPQARDLDQYWDNLVAGRNSIQEIPISRWDMNQYYDARPQTKGKIYCKWLGALDEIEYFDPLFFNISPKEAETMDPQHRLFLQEAYRAFQDAGYLMQSLNNQKCGVYLGMINNNEYNWLMQQSGTDAQSPTGNSNAIAAARVSYFFNLKGPAISIDTACSSSLVAAHLACQALANGEINLALVGGVALYLTPESYIGMCEAGMLSPDGQCKTFDNSANGFVPGEGVGALVLKRLADAEADGDMIYGVIIGSGINQDGKTNGITAPSLQSQTELVREIYQRYNIHSESISYVEMHGTGTKLGDPIELEALANAFNQNTAQKHGCAIGSVKSNIGHTSAAAGVAGIQKVLLCLKERKLVPTLNYCVPNEHFDFEASPFYVNTNVKAWESASGALRRAGVSSFGFSGTNAHLVIEEYIPCDANPRVAPLNGPSVPVLFALSAKSEQQLRKYVARMKNWIEGQTDLDLTDLCYTLQVGREAQDVRLALVTDSRAALQKALAGYLENQPPEELIVAQVQKGQSGIEFLEKDADIHALLKTWAKNHQFRKIAEFWVRGFKVNWNLLYGDPKPRRISLPGHPFEQRWCWIPEGKPDTAVVIHSAVAKVAAENIKLQVFEAVSPNNASLVLQTVTEIQTGFDEEPWTGGIVLQPLTDELVADRSMTAAKIELATSSEFSATTAVVNLQKELAAMLSKALYLESSEIEPDKSFIDLGLDSVVGVEWIKALNEKYRSAIDLSKIYEYPTIAQFADYLAQQIGQPNPSATMPTDWAIPTGAVIILGDGKEAEIRAVKADVAIEFPPTREALQDELLLELTAALYLDPAEVELDKPLIDLGLDSIIAVEWLKTVNRRYGVAIEINEIYQYPTLRQFTAFLAEKRLGQM